MGRTRHIFCLLLSFSQHNDIIVQNSTIKSVDGVLGTRTRGGRMVGADESTELWRHPGWFLVCVTLMQFMRYNDYNWILGQWLWQS